MWKQLLHKFPRKSSRSSAASAADDADPAAPSTCNGNADAAASVAAPATTANGSNRSSSAAVKRMSSAVFPSSVVAGIEPLLSFKDVSSSERQNLFVSKLTLCSAVFDFSDPAKDAAEKDMKRQALVELVEYVSKGGAPKFGEQAVAACCRMFADNLFRVFPPSYRSSVGALSSYSGSSGGGGGGENDEDEPVFDPAWSHLQLVYELLLKFIASSSLDAKVAKKYLDTTFILRLLDLFDSEDPRERDCLKAILHRIYGKFMVHRPFIRKAVSNIFYRFIFETERHNGVSELLEVFGSVISGFALPLKEEHKMFLWRTLIPLHKPRSLGVYFQQLTYCISQFIEKEPKLACTVVMGLLKYWPVTNSQKEVMFLSELEEVLETVSINEFQAVMIPLFRRISRCLTSSHFQVAERALYLWNNDHIITLISQNRDDIMPIIFPALESNSRSHWNHSVLNVTLNVKKLLSEMDPELYDACQRELEEAEEQMQASEEKRRLAWERLECAAASKPVAGNIPVLVMPHTTTSHMGITHLS